MWFICFYDPCSDNSFITFTNQHPALFALENRKVITCAIKIKKDEEEEIANRLDLSCQEFNKWIML